MNPELREDIINYYFQRIGEKDFEISQVRRDLEKKNIDPEEIKDIVRIVDNELQHYIKFKEKSKKGSGMIWLGLALMATGVALTYLSYHDIIYIGNQRILTYGPFLGGLALFLLGRSQKLRRLDK